MSENSFYETIDDITADAGIRVYAKTLEDLFCKAVLATFNEISDIDRVEKRIQLEVEAEGQLPFLLADLINECLLIHERDKFIAAKCEVLEQRESSVKLRLWGETFDSERHTSKLLIKAATYHRLRVAKEGDLYIAEVIFDI